QQKHTPIPKENLNLKYLRGELIANRNGGRLEELEFVSREDTSRVKGDFTWSWEKGFRLEGAQLDFSLVDPGGWIFEVTKPYVEVAEGMIFGKINVDWQPDRLTLSGRARVTQGVMKIPAIATTVEAVEAEMTFQEDRVVFEKLSGKSVRGVVTVGGVVDLDPAGEVDSIVFKTHFTGVSAIPLPGVYAIGRGEIDITWHRGDERAFISGDVVVDEALVAIGFGPQNGLGSTSSIDYDLRIRAERGVWLRNRESDIELGVDLIIRRVGDDELIFSGELASRQGNIYYLDHILRVTEGKLRFENVSQFDPRLDIIAELPISRNGKNDQPEKIILSLTGTLSEPSFGFRTEPPIWDESQILSYLSLNVTMDEISALEQKELLSRLLSERLLGYFQTQVAKKVRDFVSLDYLELETGILSGQGARVTVGKYVGRNMYVSYTQNFTNELNPAFVVEYYLNRRNELIAERSAEGRYSLRYRFKLRF
ncbi:MAG: translocation/assembly module TamB domain-containing protein, partial [bacterium]